MQRFSQQIPWVLVAQSVGGYDVHCEACGAGGHVPPTHLQEFVSTHSNHQSSQGTGLGDAIAAVAKPIARAFGQKPCSPCEARRRALNAAVPRVWPRR
jgi:hypothetical protein